MNRGAIKALSETVWIEPLTDHNLELALVPSEAGRILRNFDLMSDDLSDRMACARVFVDFRNYENEDGTPVENTMENRLELYQVVHIREAIRIELLKRHNVAISGEGDAASD